MSKLTRWQKSDGRLKGVITNGSSNINHAVETLNLDIVPDRILYEGDIFTFRAKMKVLAVCYGIFWYHVGGLE